MADDGVDAAARVDAGPVDAGPVDAGADGSLATLPCDEAAFPADLRAAIQARLDAYPDVPGLVVAVHDPARGNLIAAFGEADPVAGTAMPADGVFDVGSVHKLFKWVALERLVDAGALSFTDPVSAHVPRPALGDATVLDLTRHATGMVDIGEGFYADVVARWQAGSDALSYTYDEMMDFLAAEADTEGGLIDGFSVGAAHHYSSYGPVVAAAIIEAVTGEAPLPWIRAEVIDRLGLANTRYIGLDPEPAGIVLGHGADDGSDAAAPKSPPPEAIRRLVSSGHRGALFSTACDMVNFVRVIHDPAAGYLSADLIASRSDDALDVGGAYAVGRGVFNHHGFGAGRFWGHAGDGMSGHASLVGFDPGTGVAAAVHTNLRPLYMALGHQLHFEIMGLLGAWYGE